MRMNGWTDETLKRWTAAMRKAGFVPVSRYTMDNDGTNVMVHTSYWRSCLMVRDGRSISAEIDGGRGWPERLAAQCVEADMTLRARAAGHPHA